MNSVGNKNRDLRHTLFLTAVVVIGIIISFLLFYRSNVRRIAGQNERYITDITTQRAGLVQNLFDENLRYIESSAMVMETEFRNRGLDPASLQAEREEDIDPAAIRIISDVLSICEERFAFSYLRFIDTHGRDFTTHEKAIQANVADREYFRRGMSGSIGMTYILDSKVTNERQVGFYCPLRMDGEIIGLAVGFYGESFMHDILTMTLFEYDCEVLLCDASGTVIYNTFGNNNYRNFPEKIRQDGSVPAHELDRIRFAFSQRQNATFDFTDAGSPSVGCIAYVSDVSDLFIVMNFPASAYRHMLVNSNLNGVVLLASLIGIFTIATVWYVIRFITQRKKLIAEAKNSNDIHAAVSLLFENFIIVDAETGRYDYIEGMPEIAGIPNVGEYDVFIADLLERFPVPAEREEAARVLRFDHILSEMNAGRDVLSYNLHAPIASEEWFTYNFIVVERRNGQVKEFIIARQDITGLQKKEEETRRILEKARDEAEKGNRAKSDFLANMSHDIRTPMNAIIGYTNIANAHLEDRDLVRDSLDKIGSSSQYLLSLINDILDMSKIESGNVQLSVRDSDLSRIFHRIADITHSQSRKKNLRVHFDVSAVRHVRVRADELRFEQIIINIISNAIKYTPEGNDIFIEAAEESAADGTAQYRFAVRDTGIGMSEDFLPHIFDSFSREKSSRIDKIQGTGLGMAITAHLVKLMNGTIDVKSELGKGSEFTVRLSLETIPDAEPAPAVSKALILGRKPEENAELSALLTRMGIPFSVADNLEDAMQAVAEGSYDLLLFNTCSRDDMRCASQLISGIDTEKAILIKIVERLADAIDYADKDLMSGILEKPIFQSDILGVLTGAAEKKSRAPAETVSLKGQRILLVEDNDINAEIAGMILAEYGVEMERAENGREGVDKFRSSAPGCYAAVLMDIQMPVMNGYDAARTIRQLDGDYAKTVPIIAMSANAYDEDVKASLDAGMNAHLTKPFDPADLLQILQRFIAGAASGGA